ncbi:MAG: Cobalt transport protein [Chloroflexi bacterium]|nr:Cobalt transport protein [Chloroflexota bacterium]
MQSFSLFAPRNSFIHRLNPLTKLSLMGFLLVGGLFLPGIWSGYLLFLLVLLPLALLGKVTGELVRSAWKIVVPFAISVFLIQGFLWPHGTPIIYIGPFSLKAEGLRFAIASTGRILIIVSSFLWFSLTTRPDHLMTSLTQVGFPTNLAYVIVATLQIVPRLQTRAQTILDAQRARGVETEGSFRQRTRAMIPLVIPLILGSLVDVEERALAVEARAFGHPGKKTYLVEIAQADWEPLVRWAILIGVVAVVAIRILFMLGLT